MSSKSKMHKFSFRWGIPFLILFTGSLKSYYLAQQISSEWQRLFTQIFAFDLRVFGAGLLLAFVAACCAWRPLHWLLVLLLYQLFLLSLIDAGLVYSVNERLNVYDILRFSSEWNQVSSFLGIEHVFILLVTVIFLFPSFKISRFRSVGIIATAICSIYAPTLLRSTRPVSLEKYMYSILDFNRVMPQPSTSISSVVYPEEEVRYYSEMWERIPRLRLPREGQNIILIVLESLSAVESKKISGIRDTIPVFDRLSEEGLLFPNFFANYEASEGGIISLLSGVLPISFPTSSRFLFIEFGRQESVIQRFKELGYHTEFLTTTELKFLDLDRYLKGVAFDYYVGREEVPEFKAAPQIVQYAPSDDYLYRKAIERLDLLRTKKKSIFMTIVTVSTHKKYKHPYGGANTAEAVWGWTLEQLVGFYEDLKARKFFDDGLLIVTGDHRVMQPVSEEETRRYGDSAKARILLLLIGEGIPRGKVDRRFFQQSDLFSKLADVLQPEVPLSPNPVWVDRYTVAWGKLRQTGRVTVYDEENQGRVGYDFYIGGREIEWSENKKPSAWRRVEEQVHTQRAVHQAVRQAKMQSCQLIFADESLVPSTSHGLRGEVYKTTKIEDLIGPEKQAFRERFVSELINYQSLSVMPGNMRRNFALSFTGFLEIKEEGVYWFGVESDDGSCLAINKQVVLERNKLSPGQRTEVQLRLKKGMYRIDLRYFQIVGGAKLRALWIPPGVKVNGSGWNKWKPIPTRQLFLPKESSAELSAQDREHPAWRWQQEGTG